MRLINGIVWFGSNLAEEGFGCDKWTVLGGNLLYAQSSDHKIDNFPTVFFSYTPTWDDVYKGPKCLVNGTV